MQGGGGALVDGNGKDSSCNNPTRAASRTLPLKLLKPLLLSAVLATGFLAVLLLGGGGGTASYSLRRLTVPDVLAAAQPARAWPCAQQLGGVERWTRAPPESAWHNMSDEELLWAASWEPRVRRYPYRRVPKVAFMFLTRGPLPLAPLWERFFNASSSSSSRELYSVYVHSTPGYRPDFPPTSVFYRRQVPSKILQSIGGADDTLYGDNFACLGSLQEKLERSVVSKRFLLVLDDVWNDEGKTELENRGVWKKVLAPLCSAASGSKILVNTRMKLVAEILNATHVVSLDGLRSSDCWLLLKEAALGGESMHVPPELQEIGKAIAAKVKGSPLAAKALGQMLRNTRSTRKWRTLLDTEISDNIIISSLQLSYQHLPGHLQRCFAYCSIFPRNWRFDRDKLVKIWVTLGFIEPSRKEGKWAEDLGQEYFDDLLSRSFFHQTLFPR